ASRSHRATIIFVAFTAEETGRQGSLEFVKAYLQAQEPPINLRAMINLDMIGGDAAASDADQQSVRLYSAEPNDSPSRQLARQVAFVMRSYLGDVTPVLESAEERIGYWGDHQSFRAAGYPAIRMIQGTDDVSRLHSTHDTPENIRPGYLMRVTRAALLTVSVLANGPPAPTDLALRATPNRADAKTLVWTPSPGAAEYLIALRQSSSLFFDQIFTVKASPTPQYTWTGFDRYAAVAIAAVDSAGHMGPICPETSIASIWRP